MSKVEIVSKEMLKPSSPTPAHLRDLKLSLLDQLAPPIYIPMVLFYSAADITSFGADFKTISEKLKTSLSKVLTLYYPFCGTRKGTDFIECNDEGVLYLEAKAPTNLSDYVKGSRSQILELLPFEPYSPTVEHVERRVIMAIQLNEFRCGGIGIGMCLSHKVTDGVTTTLFLNAWAETARTHGSNTIAPPQMEASWLFPPINGLDLDIAPLMVADSESLATKCFLFNETSLSSLKATLGTFSPTRVEAVTALVWKSAVEATKASCKGTALRPSFVTHAVTIRSRTSPPLSKHLFGNLWLYSSCDPLVVDGDGKLGLHDYAKMGRDAARKYDANFMSRLQGDGLVQFAESLMEGMFKAMENGYLGYGFNSWTRFGFNEVDFGWGKPSRVRSINLPMKNVVALMSTVNGDGIEAWVTLTEHDMVEFERNPELLRFASLES